MKSIKDIYKIGKGPSSSHTMGPFKAVRHYMENHQDTQSLHVILYGSLAATGKGHLTDIAIEEAFSTWKPTDKETIENNIRSILNTKKLHIRIPLIHSFNDDEKSLEGFIGFFNSLSGDFDVEILAYHEYGKEKWIKLGKEYAVTDGFVNQETIKKFIDTLKANSIKVIKT